MLPREHGAYAQALLPQLTALVLGSGRPGAFLLAGAVLGAFLLHEPVLLVLGRRGVRRQRAEGPALKPWTWGLAALVALAGGLGMWMSPTPARLAAGLTLGLGAGAALFLASGKEKTLPGELWVAAALSLALIPTALAAGLPLKRALGAALIWLLVFGLGILSVRALIAGWKSGRRGPRRVASILALGALGAGLGAFLTLHAPAALALAPPSMVCLWAAGAGVPPRRLRAVGWALAASTAASFLLLVLAWT